MTATRDWAGLPELVLLSVLHRLSSLLDLYSFAGVCHPWRLFLRSSAAAIYFRHHPPLLLRPNPHPSQDPAFLLETPSESDPTLRSLLLPETLTSLLCLGSSHGHLILLRRRTRQPILADALTGAQILTPKLPSDRYPYYYAALTAPPFSPDCLLLLFYSPYDLLSCRLNDPEWKRHRLGPGVSYIVRILSFNGRIFAVNDRAQLLAFDFTPSLSVKLLKVGGIPKKLAYDRWHFGPQLVESGGELLLVLFVQHEERVASRIDVYRLNFEKMVWLKVENLGDYSLFIDCGGRCPVSCSRPELWGGESNHAYLAGPGCSTWKEFALDGNMVFHRGASPLSSSNFSEPRMPSPIWVYPSLFF